MTTTAGTKRTGCIRFAEKLQATVLEAECRLPRSMPRPFPNSVSGNVEGGSSPGWLEDFGIRGLRPRSPAPEGTGWGAPLRRGGAQARGFHGRWSPQWPDRSVEVCPYFFLKQTIFCRMTSNRTIL